MNGAQIMVKTAVKAGVEVCFTNPGTTELPIVTAFDSMGGIHPVLCLFEGVCTGAADGYGRMKQKPAMTLLHLGPGLSNGLANLHNARRGQTPLLNIIGDHASWHGVHDPGLTMDIDQLCRTVSGFHMTCRHVNQISSDTATAICAANQGQIASLIVPNDIQWLESNNNEISTKTNAKAVIDKDMVVAAARHLKQSSKAVLIIGSKALTHKGLEAAARLSRSTGCNLMTDTFPARMERGAGLPDIERISYMPELAAEQIALFDTLILAGIKEPIAWFGYRNIPSRYIQEHQKIVYLTAPDANPTDALQALADELDAPSFDLATAFSYQKLKDLPEGKLTAEKISYIIAALQPENAIVVEEAITASLSYYPLTSGISPFTLLLLTGGSIGQGMPVSIGAALACPDRPVINYQADGSAMFTVQSLWTQAREGLNITTLLCSNRSYDVLKFELFRLGAAAPGPHTQAVTTLDNPALNWVEISKGFGVPAQSVDTAQNLVKAFETALKEPGPHFIEMVL